MEGDPGRSVFSTPEVVFSSADDLFVPGATILKRQVDFSFFVTGRLRTTSARDAPGGDRRFYKRSRIKRQIKTISSQFRVDFERILILNIVIKVINVEDAKGEGRERLRTRDRACVESQKFTSKGLLSWNILLLHVLHVVTVFTQIMKHACLIGRGSLVVSI